MSKVGTLITVIVVTSLVAGIILYLNSLSEKESTHMASLEPSRPPIEGCAWEETTGAGLVVLTQSCDFDGEKVRVAPSETLPGYFIEKALGEDPYQAQEMVLQVFTRSNTDSLDEVEKVITQAIDMPPDDACIFVPLDDKNSKEKAFYEFISNGAFAGSCGEYEATPDHTKYFEIHTQSPHTVLFVNLTDEEPLFDETQIQIAETQEE